MTMDLPALVAHATERARAEGMGAPEDLDGAAWERLLAGLDAQAGADWPRDWRASLSAWRDRQRLRADGADAELAARGEVFAREDDA